MMDAIKADFAAAVRKETGADIEFTMIDVDRFSIYSETGDDFQAAVDFVQQIPGVTIDEVVTFDDGEACAYFWSK